MLLLFTSNCEDKKSPALSGGIKPYKLSLYFFLSDKVRAVEIKHK